MLVSNTNGTKPEVTFDSEVLTEHVVQPEITENKDTGWFGWLWKKPQEKQKEEPKTTKKSKGFCGFGGDEELLLLDESEDINNVVTPTEEQVICSQLQLTTQNLQTAAQEMLAINHASFAMNIQLEMINHLSSQLANLLNQIQIFDTKIESLKNEIQVLSKDLPKLNKNLSVAKAAVTKKLKDAQIKHQIAIDELDKLNEILAHKENELISLSQERTDRIAEQGITLRLLNDKQKQLEETRLERKRLSQMTDI